MNPIELLLKYPGFASQIVPQMRPRTEAVNQNALDMAMQMSTPLMVGATRPRVPSGDLADVMGMIANRTTRGMKTNPQDYQAYLETANDMLGKKAATKMATYNPVKLAQEILKRLGK